MRILIVSNSYPPVLGGLQTAVHKLSQLLQKAARVEVVTNRYPRSLQAHETLEGVSVSRYAFIPFSLDYLASKRLDLFLASLFLHPLTLIRLYVFMQRFKPDVLNVHFPLHQIPFVLFLRKYFSFQLVVSLHGNEILKWFDENDTLISINQSVIEKNHLTFLLQEADAVTACSSYLLNKAIELVPAVRQKGHVTHNGVDMERFDQKQSYAHQNAYCFAFGRLTHQKGFDLLIKAFGAIAQEHPDLDLILAGDGEQLQALEKLVADLKLSRRVIFFGRATPEQVVELLLGCRFAVVPSRREPFGIVALEVMAAGKALIATRVGGLPEFVDASINPMVFPSVDALMTGLEELLTTQDLGAIGRKNQKLAENFSWDIAGENYSKIFSTLLANDT